MLAMKAFKTPRVAGSFHSLRTSSRKRTMRPSSTGRPESCASVARNKSSSMQAFASVHLTGELGDRRLVFQVAPGGHMVHEQMLQNEMASLVDVVRQEPEPAQNLPGHFGAAARVIFASNGLAHVVQQGREKEHRGPGHFGRETTIQRVFMGDVAAHQGAQAID